MSCDKVDILYRNSMNHLKRQLPKCEDYKERMTMKRKIIKNEEKLKKEKRSRGYGTLPHL